MGEKLNHKEYYLDREDMFSELRWQNYKEDMCRYCLSDCSKCRLFNFKKSPHGK